MTGDSMEIDDTAPSANAPTSNQSSEPRTADKAVAVRSVEGWVIAVANVHEEASEDDITEMFGEFGDVKSVQLNLDRRSGFVKGYAFLEYSTVEEAEAAIRGTNGQELLEQELRVDFAFTRAPPNKNSGGGGSGPRGERSGGRNRSRSPGDSAANARAAAGERKTETEAS